MRKTREIQDEIQQGKNQVESIVAQAERDARDLSKDEASIVDGWLGSKNQTGRLDVLCEELDRSTRLESEWKARVMQNLGPALDRQLVESGIKSAKPKTLFRDSSGRPIQAFGKGDSVAATIPDYCPDGMGQLIQAAIGGVKSWHHPSVRNAMSGQSNPAGGYLITEELFAGVFDFARAKSALMQAGTNSVRMSEPEMRIASVASDPSFEIKAENARFTGTDIAFRELKLEARTIGNVVTMSRELAEDAANMGSIVSGVLGRALAVSIDDMALNGNSGGTSLNGLLHQTAIDTTGTTAVGSLEWLDIHNAATAIRKRNHSPSSAILNPESYGDLLVKFGQDLWTNAPPSLAGVNFYDTSNCPLASGVVGDFSHCLFGLRQQALVEITMSGDEAFERHQVKVKITWRGCFGVTDPAAFHILSGIT